MHTKRRKNILKRSKGYLGRRKNTIKSAKEAILKAEKYAYRDRRTKKRDMRQLWTIRINAGARQHGISYSRFINKLSKSNITINRKVLAELAASEPAIFKSIVESVKE